jgi:hypothetical protein
MANKVANLKKGKATASDKNFTGHIERRPKKQNPSEGGIENVS